MYVLVHIFKSGMSWLRHPAPGCTASHHSEIWKHSWKKETVSHKRNWHGSHCIQIRLQTIKFWIRGYFLELINLATHHCVLQKEHKWSEHYAKRKNKNWLALPSVFVQLWLLRTQEEIQMKEWVCLWFEVVRLCLSSVCVPETAVKFKRSKVHG